MCDRGIWKRIENLTYHLFYEEQINAFKSKGNSVFDKTKYIYVDRNDDGTGTLERYKKKSFYWYKKVIESNGEAL